MNDNLMYKPFQPKVKKMDEVRANKQISKTVSIKDLFQNRNLYIKAGQRKFAWKKDNTLHFFVSPIKIMNPNIPYLHYDFDAVEVTVTPDGNNNCDDGHNRTEESLMLLSVIRLYAQKLINKAKKARDETNKTVALLIKQAVNEIILDDNNQLTVHVSNGYFMNKKQDMSKFFSTMILTSKAHNKYYNKRSAPMVKLSRAYNYLKKCMGRFLDTEKQFGKTKVLKAYFEAFVNHCYVDLKVTSKIYEREQFFNNNAMSVKMSISEFIRTIVSEGLSNKNRFQYMKKFDYIRSFFGDNDGKFRRFIQNCVSCKYGQVTKGHLEKFVFDNVTNNDSAVSFIQLLKNSIQMYLAMTRPNSKFGNYISYTPLKAEFQLMKFISKKQPYVIILAMNLKKYSQKEIYQVLRVVLQVMIHTGIISHYGVMLSDVSKKIVSNNLDMNCLLGIIKNKDVTKDRYNFAMEYFTCNPYKRNSSVKLMETILILSDKYDFQSHLDKVIDIINRNYVLMPLGRNLKGRLKANQLTIIERDKKTQFENNKANLITTLNSSHLNLNHELAQKLENKDNEVDIKQNLNV